MRLPYYYMQEYEPKYKPIVFLLLSWILSVYESMPQTLKP